MRKLRQINVYKFRGQLRIWIQRRKYSEFTELEYLKAREDKNRWFISFGDSVLECEESEYKKYFSEKNHSDYTQRDKNGKKIIPILLEQYTYSESARAIVSDSTNVPFEEHIIEKISTGRYVRYDSMLY